MGEKAENKKNRDRVEEELSKGADLSIIALVDAIVEEAHGLGASDIHIDPQEKDIAVRMRIDGVLSLTHSIPKTIHSEIITRIKVLADLRTDEHQTPQDGRFRLGFNGETPIDVRVSVAPTYHGENAVLRLLAERSDKFALEMLGFSEKDQEKIQRAMLRPFGMILATGPTGSGKTTSLYTVLKELNEPEVSIITIEDPIEYAIAGINQMQVNSRTGLTFANGLRSMLRQDPDIIMVGEIRDKETASLAINTALTGHLVLSSLHTTDAATTLPRLIDLGMEPYLIAATVNVVIGQRLVRKICPHCKEEHKLTEGEEKAVKDLGAEKFLDQNKRLFRGKGCDKCNESGYKGRIGIYEVMPIDEAIREAMLKKCSSGEIRKVAMSKGMTSMLEDGFQKVIKGTTTLEEVLRVIQE